MADVTLDYTLTGGTPAVASQVMANFNEIVTAVNDLDEENLGAALAAKLGVSQSGSVRRGKSIVSGAESRSNAAYGLLGTPDRVQSVVLPTDGLIAVAYQATWQESVAGAGRAAIFLGSNQVVGRSGGASPNPTQAAAFPTGGNVSQYAPLASYSGGLMSSIDFSSGADDLTTGSIVGLLQSEVYVEINGTVRKLGDQLNNDNSYIGGPCWLYAAAGSYDVSVQFKASSGSVTVKNRRLWVWSLGF